MEISEKKSNKNVYEWSVLLDEDLTRKLRNMAYLSNRWIFINELTPRPKLKEIEESYEEGVFDEAAVKLYEEEIKKFVAQQDDYPDGVIGEPDIIEVATYYPGEDEDFDEDEFEESGDDDEDDFDFLDYDEDEEEEDEYGEGSLIEVTLRFFGKPEVSFREEPESGLLEESIARGMDGVEANVDRLLDYNLRKSVRLTPKEEPSTMEDFLNVDYEEYLVDSVDGQEKNVRRENITLDLNPRYQPEAMAQLILQDFGNRLIGAERGDVFSLEGDTPLGLGGRRITVNDVYAAEMPEADDEFAVEISEFDTIDELKESYRSQEMERLLEEVNREKGVIKFQEALSNALVDYPSEFGGEYRLGQRGWMDSTAGIIQDYLAQAQSASNRLLSNPELTPYLQADADSALKGRFYAVLTVLAELLDRESLLEAEGDITQTLHSLIDMDEIKEVKAIIDSTLKSRSNRMTEGIYNEIPFIIQGLLSGEFALGEPLYAKYSENVGEIDQERALEIYSEFKAQEEALEAEDGLEDFESDDFESEDDLEDEFDEIRGILDSDDFED